MIAPASHLSSRAIYAPSKRSARLISRVISNDVTLRRKTLSNFISSSKLPFTATAIPCAFFPLWWAMVYNSLLLWLVVRLWVDCSFSSSDWFSSGSGSVDTVSCDLCGKKYPVGKKRAMINHLKYDCHQIAPKFKCELCSYGSRRKKGLAIHYTRYHPQFQPS